MLRPEQVNPFILHEDSYVRTMAAEYFGKGYIPEA